MTAALVTAGPLAAQTTPGSVSDFKLPPAPTPTASSNVQGPVDTDAPVPRAPRVIATGAPNPAPTLTVPTPAPTQRSPAPRATAGPRILAPTPAQPVGQRPPGNRPVAAPPLEPPSPTLDRTAPVGPVPVPATPPVLDNADIAPPSTPLAEDEGSNDWLLWGAFALVALAAAGFAWLKLRPRTTLVRPTVVPDIERPRPIPGVRADPPLDVAQAPPDPIGLALTSQRLSVTLIAATFTYRLEIANGTEHPLRDLAIGADVVAAHARLPVDQQLANTATPLDERHRIAEIAPGDKVIVTGEIRVPLKTIHPIRQGDAALFVPLARFRVAVAGVTPRNETFVIGQLPTAARGAALRPFRLDLGPRIYSQIAQRMLAPAT